MRVGLQKISHSRGLHRELRLQVEQQEVELPSIEGLIFINIPRCGAGLPGDCVAWAEQCQLGLICACPSLLLGQLGLRG